MEIEYGDIIVFEKELNDLDKFTIDFVSILNDLNINNVLVSGYVSILFGRNRASEDIDLIIDKIDKEKFLELWDKLKEFECINSTNASDAYDNYLMKDNAIRFSKKGKFIPNMEVKFYKGDLDLWTLENRKKVVLNNHELFISPLELQIPFKLLLGKGENEKDIEDAKFLYELFKDKLDMELLQEFNRKLKIEVLFKQYLE